MIKNLFPAILFALGAGGALCGATLAAVPASAQWTVFDPSNYAQNLLTAARALEQVNNQIRSLQNQARMLANQAKNLSRIDFPQLKALEQRLEAIDRLISQAQEIGYDVDRLDAQFRRQFPDNSGQVLARDQRMARARDGLEAAMASFRHTMGIQSEIVGNVRDDVAVLGEIVAASQGAEGALQAQQATNQLLALTAKQQLQIQQLMAAQFRSQSLEQARRGQVEREARERTRRFLGDGKAYTPR